MALFGFLGLSALWIKTDDTSEMGATNTTENVWQRGLRSLTNHTFTEFWSMKKATEKTKLKTKTLEMKWIKQFF